MKGEVPNLQRKARYTRYRTYTLIGVYLLMGLHIAHWLVAGKTLAPLELNEVLYTIHLGVITAGFIFMGVTVVGTLIFGRFFCSWACHILALQDLSASILEKLHIQPVHIRSRVFFVIPVAAMLYLFVWPTVERIMAGTPFPGFRVLNDADGWASFVTTDYWRNLPSVPVTLITFFSVGFLTVYLLGSRGFCQDICPYGVLFGLGDRTAPGKIKLTGTCEQCGICTAHCHSHIEVHREIKQFGKVVNANCLKDLDCVAVCPHDAISFGFTKPSFLDSFKAVQGSKAKFTFSFWEDVLLGFIVLAFTLVFRGLYDTVPFLLAITLALVCGYLTLQMIRTVRFPSLQVGRAVLKRDGQWSRVGKIYALITVLIVAISVHSGFIHYHYYRGDRLYDQLTNQRSTHEPGPQVREQAFYHLGIAEKWGLYTPLSLHRELAALYLLEKDNKNAEIHLRAMLNQDPGDREARLRLAKLMILDGRNTESAGELHTIIADSTHLHTIREKSEYAEACLNLGHLEESGGFTDAAEKLYWLALRTDTGHAQSQLALGVLLARTGRFSEAEQWLLRSAARDPESPVIHNNLGLVYIQLKQAEKAVFHLKKLDELMPGDQRTCYNLGMLLVKTGRDEEALYYLHKAETLDPMHKGTHIALSGIYQRAGNVSLAGHHAGLAGETKMLNP
ncbi:MAG: 4Fe-4S binding protein [Bacteroidia bacterium]|nr:4Fe-4S binding protein [Bacteroidia bacterium]